MGDEKICHRNKKVVRKKIHNASTKQATVL